MSDIIRCFRFQKVQGHLLTSLEASTLYFAPPTTLNDPDDCQIDIASAITRAIPKTTGKRQTLLREIQQQNLISRIQEDLPKMGVCCFSRKLDNSLMWSHYADSHKGVCLCYEIPTEFLGSRDKIGWAPLTYRNNPLTHWLINEMDEKWDAQIACLKIMLCVLAMKRKAWRYEKEGRLLRFSSGLVELPREFLKQICFGLKTPNADKKRLFHIVAKYYKNVQILKMIPDPVADTGVCAVVETLPMD